MTAAELSPRALYVAAGIGRSLVVMRPDGQQAWARAAGGRVEAIAWAPSGLRLAYVVRTASGTELRTIEGDGDHDRLLDDAVRGVRPSWRARLARARLRRRRRARGRLRPRAPLAAVGGHPGLPWRRVPPRVCTGRRSARPRRKPCGLRRRRGRGAGALLRRRARRRARPRLVRLGDPVRGRRCAREPAASRLAGSPSAPDRCPHRGRSRQSGPARARSWSRSREARWRSRRVPAVGAPPSESCRSAASRCGFPVAPRSRASPSADTLSSRSRHTRVRSKLSV